MNREIDEPQQDFPGEVADIPEAERVAFVLRIAKRDGMDLEQARKLAIDLGLNV